jgi:hypothetical protein
MNPGLLIITNKVDCKKLIEEANRPPKPPIRFRAKWGYIVFRYGASYDKLRNSGSFVDVFKFDRPRQHFFSLGFDLDPQEWGGFVIRAEVSLRKQEFNGIDPEKPGKALRRWQIDGNTTSEEISFVYKSIRGALNWFLGVGMGAHQFRVQQNTQTDYTYSLPRQTENDVELRETNGYTSLSAGIVYRNRIELRIKRQATQWSCNPANYKMNNRSNIITVGYRL